MMPYKVAFLGGSRYSRPLDQTSAAKFSLLAELVEIHVIGFSKKLRPLRFTEKATFFLLPQLPLAPLRYLLFSAAVPPLALWLIFRHRVDILIAQSPYEGFAGALAKKIADYLGRKVILIVESHGDFEESLFLYRKISFAKLYRTLMDLTAAFAFKQADMLRAISRATRQQLESRAPGKPIFQFPTWTNIDIFQGNLHRGPKHPQIAFVGLVTPLKGIHFLIDAFAQIAEEYPSLQLLIIGKTGDEKYAESLKCQAAGSGLSERVLFKGALPPDEVAGYMAQSLALVLPSLSEGLGRVIIEAMTCATPVIGTQVGGIPDLIRDGETGFLAPPGSADALADRLRWLLAHPEDSLRMGQKAQEYAGKYYSNKAYIDSYAGMFHQAGEQLRLTRNHAEIGQS
ncbi:MAG: glycosyltransferase family 4 protein [Armatimonadetes bacterium]|nr:glycosyltransferase family 4 protein [Armatimonadota bacterium]